MTDTPPPPGSPAGAGPSSDGVPPPPTFAIPPGYAEFRSAPVEGIARVRGLSKAASILMVLSIVVGLAAIPMGLSVADRAADFLDGRITETEFRDSFSGFALVQLLTMIVVISSAVVSMIWLYRIAANVRRFGRATVWGPVWAVFGWFLPPLLYVIPLLMLREMWKASNPDVAPGDEGWRKGREQPLLWGWWVTYSVIPLILAVVRANSLFRVGGPVGGDVRDSADALRDFGAAGIGSIVSTVIGAVLWILIVRALTNRHTELTGER